MQHIQSVKHWRVAFLHLIYSHMTHQSSNEQFVELTKSHKTADYLVGPFLSLKDHLEFPVCRQSSKHTCCYSFSGYPCSTCTRDLISLLQLFPIKNKALFYFQRCFVVGAHLKKINKIAKVLDFTTNFNISESFFTFLTLNIGTIPSLYLTKLIVGF